MLRNKPLALLTWADIEALNGVAVEGQQLDFKSGFDKTPGADASNILAQPKFRRTIASVLIFFANAAGGTVVIGVGELPDTAGLAGPPKPVPDVINRPISLPRPS